MKEREKKDIARDERKQQLDDEENRVLEWKIVVGLSADTLRRIALVVHDGFKVAPSARIERSVGADFAKSGHECTERRAK